MAEHADKTQDRKSQAAGHKPAQPLGGSGLGSGFVDNRMVAVMQRKLQTIADGSMKIMQLNAFQDFVDAEVSSVEKTQNSTSNNEESARTHQLLNPVVQLNGEKKRLIKKGAVIGAIAGLGVGALIGAPIGWAVYKYRKNKQPQAQAPIPALGRRSLGEEDIEFPTYEQGVNNDQSRSMEGPIFIKDNKSDSSTDDYTRFLAETRKGAADGQMNDSEKRIPLSSEERDTEGLGLLPMLSDKKMMDEKTPTIKQYSKEDRKEFTYKLNEGKLVKISDEQPLTTIRDLSDHMNAMKALMNVGLDDAAIDQLFADGKAEEKIAEVGGMYIFVMNSEGQIFAGEEMFNVVHHSSFLAGGAVAAAGNIRVKQGEIEFVNNMSGHYHPGPAYLWQALIAMAHQGVDLASVGVNILNVKTRFANAKEFVERFDPIQNPRFFDTKYAIDFLNGDKQKGID